MLRKNRYENQLACTLGTAHLKVKAFAYSVK